MLRRAGVTKDNENYRRHHQAHINILKAMNVMIGECSLLDSKGKTSEAYRLLSTCISKLYEEHHRMFDSIYI